MKKTLPVLLVTTLLSTISAFSAEPFPIGPDSKLTPGSLCAKAEVAPPAPGVVRCRRDVSPAVKKEIIATYDAVLGHNIQKMDRRLFKIDHYIPLCMGGSNERDNLWPQHESVYKYTDQLEFYACQKMAQGKLRQDEAIQIIKRAKNDLKEAPRLTSEVEGL